MPCILPCYESRSGSEDKINCSGSRSRKKVNASGSGSGRNLPLLALSLSFDFHLPSIKYQIFHYRGLFVKVLLILHDAYCKETTNFKEVRGNFEIVEARVELKAFNF